jgi:FkbM family methyltransferase
VTVYFSSLFGEQNPYLFEGKFEEWGQKRLELLSLFLSRNPTILQVGSPPMGDFRRIWPSCKVLDEFSDSVDLLCLNANGEELPFLNRSPQMLSSATCVYVHTYSPHSDLKKFMEQSGFQLLAHWYRKGLEGDAIFVKQDYFYNRNIHEFLRKNKVTYQKYQIYHEPQFRFYYCIEDETDDSIKNILKRGLPYEGNIGIMIDHLIRRGSLALDIGAHIGVHTMTMSRKVGPQGAVIAFEPDKTSYMELLKNLLINQCENVIPICKALGETLKTAHLQKHKIEEEGGDLVETITLDSLNLTNVSLIKMDIENYEYFALKGAKETILRNKPVLIFECWIGKDYVNSAPKEKANFDRVISLIESYGYEIYVIYCNDFIAFPIDSGNELARYKSNFKRLDLNAFDLGL